jgi:hypothetical protein
MLLYHHKRAALTAAARWLDCIDPGVHRRIKGLRLITAFGIAAMLGAMIMPARQENC